METKIIKVDPRELKLLEVNARFMKADEYQRLVANVKRDGCLTQLPFCCLDDDWNWVVLSGNHRVKASIDAGLKEINVQVTEDKLTKDEKIAIQLSHNSISGQDDMGILKQLYESIDDITFKEYSGLDDETLKILQDIKTDSMSANGLNYQIINIAFLPNEIKDIQKILKDVKKEIGNNHTLTLRMAEYDKYLDTINDVGKAKLIKNTAVCFMGMLSIVNKHMEELKEDWIDAAPDKSYVPINTIIKRDDIRADDGRILNKAVEKLVSQGKVKKDEKEKALVVLSKEYLGIKEDDKVNKKVKK